MKKEITKESIIEAIGAGATSLTKVSHYHGYSGSVSGSVAAKIRTLCPDVADRLAEKTVSKIDHLMTVHTDIPFTATEAPKNGQRKIVVTKTSDLLVDEVHKVETPKAKKVAKSKDPAIASEIRKSSPSMAMWNQYVI
jgi:hypothetical protein